MRGEKERGGFGGEWQDRKNKEIIVKGRKEGNKRKYKERNGKRRKENGR